MWQLQWSSNRHETNLLIIIPQQRLHSYFNFVHAKYSCAFEMNILYLNTRRLDGTEENSLVYIILPRTNL